MPIRILMPALSPTMTEGNLVKWHKNEGDLVKSGEILAEIETDKAIMELEAVDEGVLSKIILSAPKEKVQVNAVLAILLEKGEMQEDMEKELASLGTSSTQPAHTPLGDEKAKAIEKEKTHEFDTVKRVIASPLAKRLAVQKNIDLRKVQGTGPRHRIIAADIERFDQISSSSLEPLEKISQQEAPNSVVVKNQGAYLEVPFTRMRQVIGERLTYAKQNIPHFYLSVDCVLDNLLALRSTINETLSKRTEGGETAKISVNDFIVRACAVALTRVPSVNVSYVDGVIRRYIHSDVAVAVSVDGGLFTPVVFAANTQSLLQISKSVKILVQKARANKLRPEEYQGGSFCISNLGMFGVSSFSAIINPPQAAILAIGAGEKRPVVEAAQKPGMEDILTVKTVMTCTLSLDHRVIDGVDGALFLKEFKNLLEAPLELLL